MRRLEASSGRGSSSRLRRRRRCGRGLEVGGGELRASMGLSGPGLRVGSVDFRSGADSASSVADAAVDWLRDTPGHNTFPDDPKSSFSAALAQKYCPSPIVRRELAASTVAFCAFVAVVCRERTCCRWSLLRHRRHMDGVSRALAAWSTRGRTSIPTQWLI